MKPIPRLTIVMLLGILAWGAVAQAGEGITANSIRIGGVMDLEGRSRGLGLGMKKGIEAAIQGQAINNRGIEFVTLNDSYTPSKTIDSVNRLLRDDIFAMIGNVGTPTAKVALPILAQNTTPAIGFFTGAGILRPGVGDIINFRASYVQETAAVIGQALDQGIQPQEICAFVQNDAYGMAGVTGIKRALARTAGVDSIIAAIDRILSMEGTDPPRNGVGPVGVYKRNTFISKDGYKSLKDWEETQGVQCKLVVSVGTYNAIARFAAYSRYKGDNWIISAVSFTGADNFQRVLNEFGITGGILMTQVVPLNSNLPIVQEAKAVLGSDFGYVTLEGYIVGKMWLYYMNKIDGPITRANFLNTVRGSVVDLGGITLDFTDDNQGSDYVLVTYLNQGRWGPVLRRSWSEFAQGG